MFFLVLLALAIMGGVVYLAVNKNSTPIIRTVSLIALAIMVLAVVVCIIVFVKGAPDSNVIILPDMEPSEMPPEKPQKSILMPVMFIVFLIALFVMVTVLSMREKGRAAEGDEKIIPSRKKAAAVSQFSDNYDADIDWD